MTDIEWEMEFRASIPAVRVLPERLLKRILWDLIDKEQLLTLNTAVPIWVSRTDLEAVLDLDPRFLEGNESPLLLLKSPGDRPGSPFEDEVTRAEYLRRLLYAVVWKHVDSNQLSDEQVRQRFAELGPEVEADARIVLETDHIVPVDASLRCVYSHFVADCWVRLQTDAETLRWWYPSLPEIDQLRTKLWPEGFPVSLPVAPPVRVVEKPAAELVATKNDPQKYVRRGNYARAAIVLAGQGHSEEAKAVFQENILTKIGLPEAAPPDWATAIVPLLKASTHGTLPPEKRVLYELQRIALNHEQELSTIDPAGWMKSWGKEPLWRPLTRAREVIRRQALARAQHYLEKSELPPGELHALEALFEHEIERSDESIRRNLAPIILAALEQAGFIATTTIEKNSREKIVQELLDRICERGVIRFADWRDAVARNHLKLENVSGAKEWWAGDVLLRADRKLGRELDGIYRPGEVYLRGIQRGSALAFGTPIGRFFSTYIALPFGGAFLALEFLQHVIHALQGLQKFASKIFAPKFVVVEVANAPSQTVEEEGWWDDFEPNIDLHEVASVTTQAVTSSQDHHIQIVTVPTVLGLGFFILLLILSSHFRYAVGRGLTYFWRGVRGILFDIPLAIWRSPTAKVMRTNAVVKWLARRCGLAFLVALATFALTTLLGAQTWRATRDSLLVFAFVSLIKMLPTARLWEDQLREWLSDTWRAIHSNFIPGLISWCVAVFSALIRWVEQALHRVDEWLRFREGQPKPKLWLKVLLAFLWFPLAYVFRFAFYLLLEPQVNPLKHFPVVTVSHKVLYTSLIPLSNATGISEGVLGAIFTGIPGIFGFLAWELKENWRLYRANMPPCLCPVVLGHHGENARGLLRPGFHSGTIPRLFRKARRKIRTARKFGTSIDMHTFEHEWDHLGHAMETFLQREMVPLLKSKTAWQNLTPTIGHAEITNATIKVPVLVQEYPDATWTLIVRYTNEELIATIDDQLSTQLDEPTRRVLADAGVGVLAMVGAKGTEVDRDAWNRIWNLGETGG